MIIDLESLGKYKENNRIEAKKALGGLPESMWETYSAFANTMGGVILLGVEETEDRSLRAVDLPDPEGMVEKIHQILTDPSMVSSNILGRDDISVATVEGHRIIVLEVPRASRRDRPVYLNGDSMCAFRRSGEGDFRMSREEIEAMQRDASSVSPDMMIMDGLTAEDLDSQSVDSYRRRLRLFSPAAAEEEDGISMLLRIGALAADDNGEMRPTLAGLLMFGKREVLYSQVRDLSILYRSVRDDGTLETEVAEMNLYDAYFSFCEKMRDDCEKRFENVLGITDRALVSECLAQAFSICLINSDYLYGGRISVLWKRDRINFTDPGLLRGDEPTGEGGASDPRNTLILEMFNLIGTGRGMDSGMPSVFSSWRSLGWARPVIRELYDPPRTVMSLCFTDSPQGIDDEPPAESMYPEAVEYLTRKVSVSPGDLARYLGTDRRDARRILDGLCDMDIALAEDERMKTYRLKR